MNTDTQLLTELQAKQRKFSKRKAKRKRQHVSKIKSRQHSYSQNKGKHPKCNPYIDNIPGGIRLDELSY